MMPFFLALAAWLAALAPSPAHCIRQPEQNLTDSDRRAALERMLEQRRERGEKQRPPAPETPPPKDEFNFWNSILRLFPWSPPITDAPPETEPDITVQQLPDETPTRIPPQTAEPPLYTGPEIPQTPAVATIPPSNIATIIEPVIGALNGGPPERRENPDPEVVAPIVERFETNPHDPVASAALGDIAFNRGDFNLANRLLTASIEDGGRSPSVFYLRGASNMNLGRREQAVADLNQTLKLNPNHKQALELLKLASKQVGPADMKTILQSRGLMPKENARPPDLSAMADRPKGETTAESLMTTARAQMASGNLNAASNILQRAVQTAPNDADAGLLRTEVLIRQGQFEEAEKEASRILGLFPGNPLALNMRATARNRLGRYALALEDAEAVLKVMPNSALARFNRAFALAGLQRRTEAILAARQASQLDSLFMKVYLRLRDMPPGENPLLAFLEPGSAAGGGSGQAADQRERDGFRTGMSVLLGGGAAVAVFGLVLWSKRRPPAPASPVQEARPPSTGQETLGPGIVLAGNYQVEGELGRGSMGVVFKAMDLTLKRPVAVKMLRSYSRGRSESASQLLQEAQLVAGLKHPNIVQIHTVVAEGEDLILVFEYVEGRPLSAIVADFHHLPLPDIQGILRQVANALDYAHTRRIIHRDLKPGNIMVASDGTALVMDFGLAHQARQLAGRETQVNSWGSPDYMAPEQELGTVSASSDVYALGVCLYEMITGETPFPGAGALGQKQQLAFKPASQLVPGLPPETDEVLRRALQPQPDQRFQTARQLADAFDALLQQVS